jgi:RHS repeat-associated protein
VSNLVYENGNLKYILNPEGYATKNSAGYTCNYYLKDHLGNNRVVLEIDKVNSPVTQTTDYYPFGMPYANSQYPERQPYKFGGKELDEMHGLNWYDFHARQLSTAIPRFTTMDPLAEKYYSISPYAYCKNNPVNRIDPNGMADFWHNGEVIGSDGVDDQKIYVIKTTEKDFNGVAGAGLSKKDQKATINFIKDNSGNTEAFQNNGMEYTNSVSIESSADNRQTMVNEVSRDNGNGGTTDANNREYGGSIQNGVVTAETPGAVANPKTDATASISLPSGVSTFHSHPSGTVVDAPPAGTLGGTTTTYSFTQTPSPIDINAAGTSTHYVFGRSAGKVYVYTASGVQAVIPVKRFVTPKR